MAGGDYKNLLTEIIQKQIVILGPDVAISQARNVDGIKVSDDGTVMEINGEKQEVAQKLMNEYVSLSGLIVKKAMEPLLTKYPTINIDQ